MPADAREIRVEGMRFTQARLKFPAQSRAIMHADGAALKKQLQSEAKGVGHAPGLPSAITFESGVSAREMFYEAGPVKGGAGSLALLYFGNSKTGAVLKDPAFALQRIGDGTTRKLTALLVVT